MDYPLQWYFSHPNALEAGLDEAGRGCLAGPVFAAAVVLKNKGKPEFFRFLNDSKKMSERRRNELRIIIEEESLSWAVAQVSPLEIDKINILNASFLAMHRAITKLSIQPEILLIDGNRFNVYPKIPHHCIIKGDGLYYSIAAASVLAKTHRDAYMLEMHQKYPHYAWNKNKGYPSREHKQMIHEHGLTPLHRKSFNWGMQLKMGL